LFFTEGVAHLFFLDRAPRGSIGHATSTDMVTWELQPTFRLQGEKGTWNENGTPLTGCIVENDGVYYLYAGAKHPATNEQVCGVFTSSDLREWRAHPENPVLRATDPWYETDPQAQDGYMHSAWRDPIIHRDESGMFHMFLCARTPNSSVDDTGAAIAHARSRDLIYWENLPPVLTAGDRARYCEVPDVFELDGRFYAIFLDHGWGGNRTDTRSRPDAAGTFYKMAERFEGPYEWPDECLLIGSGHHRATAWAARTVVVEGDRLLYHHSASTRSAFALPKHVRSQPDGTLFLEYWEQAGSLETSVLLDGLSPGAARTASPAEHPGGPGWWIGDDRVVGTARATGSDLVAHPGVDDINVSLKITVTEGAVAGVVVRASGEFGDPGFIRDNSGIVISVDCQRQELRIAHLQHLTRGGWGYGPDDFFRPKRTRNFDTCRTPLVRSRSYHLRVLARAEFYEVYLDDRWIFTKVFEDAPRSGSVRLYVERGRAEFRDIRLSQLSPLA
jgi:hypothetical protein